MTRVWLTGWEWECCGDPFVVGDRIDFGIQYRGPDSWLAETCGEEFAATVDAVESHHEEEFTDRVRGTVTAVSEVTLEYVERRELRRPGNGAPPDAVMPTDGEEWPMTGRDLGNGLFIGSRPTRYMVVAEPVPGTTALHPASGVGRQTDDDGVGWSAANRAHEQDPPEETRTRHSFGWVVDVDEE